MEKELDIKINPIDWHERYKEEEKKKDRFFDMLVELAERNSELRKQIKILENA